MANSDTTTSCNTSTLARRKRSHPEPENNTLPTELPAAVDFFSSYVTGGVNRGVHTRGNHVKSALGVLERTATEHGLNADDIVTLVNVVTSSNKLPKTVCRRIIKSLIPATVVPETAVMKVVAVVCANIPPTDTQVWLIRWLLVVIDNVDAGTIEKLASLYALLFRQLEHTLLRCHLCQLLYLLTRDHHVRHFQVQSLLHLHKHLDERERAPVIGLLLKYKEFKPHLVAVSINSSIKVFFRAIDKDWKCKVSNVSRRNGPTTGLLTQTMDLPLLQMSKRRKVDVIPQTENIRVDTETDRPTSRCVPWTCVKNMSMSIDCGHQIQLPSQMSRVFIDKKLQFVVAVYLDSSASRRIENWLAHTLYEEFYSSASVQRQSELMCRLAELTQFLQEGIPVVDEFLVKYLQTWNGAHYQCRCDILSLVSTMRLRPFPVFAHQVLKPIHRLIVTKNVYGKCLLVRALTDLLRYWAAVEYHRIEPSNTSTTIGRPSSVFRRDVSDNDELFSALDCISSLVKYVDSICATLLQQESSNMLLTHCVLQFFELACDLYTVYGVPLLIAPSAGIFYCCLFHRNAMVVSRICAILNKCRNAYQLIRQSSVPLRTVKTTTHLVNMYILDAADLLWRMHVFRPRRPSAADKAVTYLALMSQSAVQSVNTKYSQFAGSLLMHRAFVGFAMAFIDQTQPSGTVVHPSALLAHKALFLKYLSQQHMTGIEEFIESSVRPHKHA